MSTEPTRFAESAVIEIDPVRLLVEEQLGGGATAHYFSEDRSHAPARLRTRLVVDKREGDWSLAEIEAGLAPAPYEVVDHQGNLITGIGASQLWSALVAGTLATPFSSANAQVGVSAATTGWAASTVATPNDYDFQDVPAGAAPTYTNMASGAISGATAASPCVLTVPSWTTTPTVGQVIMVTQVLGTTGIGIAQAGAAITAVTNVANPVITTGATAHGLTVGQWVAISGVVGATGVNGNFQVIAVPTTLTFQVVAAAPGAWTSGGTAFTCGTWEVAAVTATTVSLLNSTGAGVFAASANSQVFALAKYRQAATVTANPAVGGAITGITNVVNPVVTTTSAHGLSNGQLVQIAGVVGAVGANGIFAVSAVTATTYTITLAVAPGAWTSGGTTNLLGGVQWVAVFGTSNAIHVWGAFGITTGGAATNKQAAPPPTLLNHAVSALGTKGASSTWTATISTSIA
ncbi:MAG: hypothetical protein NVSMB60_08050 [Mycobacterium sp.]